MGKAGLVSTAIGGFRRSGRLHQPTARKSASCPRDVGTAHQKISPATRSAQACLVGSLQFDT